MTTTRIVEIKEYEKKTTEMHMPLDFFYLKQLQNKTYDLN